MSWVGRKKSFYRDYLTLEEKGHEVFVFATDKDPYFIPDYKYSYYFPKFQRLSSLPAYQRIIKAPKYLYNPDVESRLNKYIQEIKPDVAHLHAISAYLTPAVLNACYKNNIPVVITLHDAWFVCPATTMLKGKEYCRKELCIGGNPIYCLLNQCNSNNIVKSFNSVFEFLFRRVFKFYDKVSCFITRVKLCMILQLNPVFIKIK